MPTFEGEHFYLSTACLHDRHDRCRLVCKFCGAACACHHHYYTSGEAVTNPENVDNPATPDVDTDAMPAEPERDGDPTVPDDRDPVVPPDAPAADGDDPQPYPADGAVADGQDNLAQQTDNSGDPNVPDAPQDPNAVSDAGVDDGEQQDTARDGQ